jgi:hypothetical protein
VMRKLLFFFGGASNDGPPCSCTSVREPVKGGCSLASNPNQPDPHNDSAYLLQPPCVCHHPV